jgi:hypothetical protein
MAKVPGFAKAFAGRWRIAAEFSGKGTTRMTRPLSRIRLCLRTRLSSSTAC